MLAGVVGVLVVNRLDGDHLPTLGVATSVGHAVAALPVTRLTKEYNLNNLIFLISLFAMLPLVGIPP